MKKKVSSELYLLLFLVLLILGLVIFGPSPDMLRLSEDYIEVNVLESPAMAENLVGQALTKERRYSCSDSDGAIDEFTAGYAKGFLWKRGDYKAYLYPDKCIESGRRAGYVREMYCSGDRPKGVYKKCSNGCENIWNDDIGKNMGVCKEINLYVCTDSDGGDNPEVPGKVETCTTTGDIGLCSLNIDVCQDGSTLTEYTCNGDSVYSITHQCEYGCSNGACRPRPPQATCTDSDGGLNYYEKGEMTILGEVRTDTCGSHGGTDGFSEMGSCQGDYCILREYLCGTAYSEVGQFIKYDYYCPGGCRDGACVGIPSNFPKPDLFLEGIDLTGNGNELKVIPIISRTENFFGDFWIEYMVKDVNGREIDSGGKRASFNPRLGLINHEKYLEVTESEYIVEVWIDYSPGSYMHNIVDESNEDNNYFKLSTGLSCTDSDGGKEYYVAGSAIGHGRALYDHCGTQQCINTGDPENPDCQTLEPNILREAYCDANGPQYELYECPNGCSDGACIREGPICGNGICEPGEEGVCAPCTGSYCPDVVCSYCIADCACTDTDGGNDPYTYGTIKGPNANGNVIEDYDRCSLIVDTGNERFVEACEGPECKLHEKYCNDDSYDGNNFKVVTTRDYYCDSGCANGACLGAEKSCMGLGIEPETSRYFTLCAKEGYDTVCFNKYTGAYQGCGRNDRDDCTEFNVNAERNIRCTAGTCTDSDGGQVYNVKGTTEGIAGNHVMTTDIDRCKDDKMLIEWYCIGVYRTNTNYECPNGCRDGACLPKPNNYCCPQVTDLDGDGDIDCKDDWLCCCGGQGTYGPPCERNNFGCYYSCGDCSTCGDNRCSTVETCSNCPQDCGVCPTLLSCETLGGKMYIASDGTGFIGCDTKIFGDFDDAYCIGEYTKQQAYLVPDSYNRENQYFATLRNLNPDEVVRVYYNRGDVSTECEPALNMPGCTDTDGGVDIYTYGSTTGYQPKLGMKYTADDMCLNGTGSATGAVQESWCEGNELHTEVMQCSVGCQNGACIKESSCSSSGVFCGGIAGIPCCAGLSCQYEGTYPDAGGICRSLTTDCADSDGGLNIYQYGVVKGSGKILYDKCVYSSTGIMSTTLNEAYCSIRGPAYQRYECTFGCGNGACL